MSDPGFQILKEYPPFEKVTEEKISWESFLFCWEKGTDTLLEKRIRTQEQ